MDNERITNINIQIEELEKEKLIELGYFVLKESLLVLRHLPDKLLKDKECGVYRISNATHNLPMKLWKREERFLREEIMRVLSIFFALSQKNDVFFPFAFDSLDVVENFITDNGPH
jgi:hypothetical protein